MGSEMCIRDRIPSAAGIGDLWPSYSGEAEYGHGGVIWDSLPANYGNGSFNDSWSGGIGGAVIFRYTIAVPEPDPFVRDSQLNVLTFPDSPQTLARSGQKLAALGTAPSLSNFQTNGDSLIVVELSTTRGTISLPENGGLELLSGYVTFEGAEEIHFKGVQSDINAALAEMTVQSSSAGSAKISISAYEEVSIPEVAAVASPWNRAYEILVDDNSLLTWNKAKQFAESRTVPSTVDGTECSGYLTSITSTEENALVYSHSGRSWIGASASTWDGNWSWSGGPEDTDVFWTGGASGSGGSVQNSGYNNWSTGEPNNSESGKQLYAVIGYIGSTWDNVASYQGGSKYVVEYGDDSCTPAVKAVRYSDDLYAYFSDAKVQYPTSADGDKQIETSTNTTISSLGSPVFAEGFEGTGGIVKATLSTSSATAKVGIPADSRTGLTRLVGDDWEDDTIAFQGTLTDVNAALDAAYVVNTTNENNVTVELSVTDFLDAAVFPENNNFYEARGTGAGEGVTWWQALSAVNGLSKDGFGPDSNAAKCRGYLASITTAAENAYLSSKLNVNAWIGGADDVTEGTWGWVGDPDLGGTAYSTRGYTFWIGDNTGAAQKNPDTDVTFYAGWNPESQPDNYQGSEDFAELQGSGVWNDLPFDPDGGRPFFVEYGSNYCFVDDAQKTITQSFQADFVTTPVATVDVPDDYNESVGTAWKDVFSEGNRRPVSLVNYDPASTVTVTVSSEHSTTTLRLNDTDSASPGTIEAQRGTLSQFDQNSGGLQSFAFSGTVADVNAALEGLEIRGTSNRTSTVTIDVNPGEEIVFNGHSYKVVSSGTAIRFSDAIARAAATRVAKDGGGFCQGYLAVVTSEEEREFLNSKLGGSQVWLAGVDDGGPASQTGTEVWDGNGMSYSDAARALITTDGTGYDTSEEIAEGNFFWAAGPERGQFISSGLRTPVSNAIAGEGYTDNSVQTDYPWNRAEPNNYGGDEDFIHILSRNTLWNDYPLRLNSVKKFVIEYGGLTETGTFETYTNAPFGTDSDIRAFEAEYDDNLTDVDWVGTNDGCTPAAADPTLAKSNSFDVTFQSAPSLNAVDVSNLTKTSTDPDPAQFSLQLNAVVNPGGNSTATRFVWRVGEDDLSQSTSSSAWVTKSGTTNQNISATLTGIAANVTVYWKAVAGSLETPVQSFSTPNAPTAITGSVDLGSPQTSVTFNGSINPQNATLTATGNDATKFAYSTSPNLSGASYVELDTLPSGTTAVDVSASVTGLTAGVTYYYRLQAKNTDGRSNSGVIKSFTPLAGPSVTTVATTPVVNNATLKGTINPNGSPVASLYFEYGQESDLSDATNAPGLGRVTGSSVVAVEYDLEALAPGTYYYRLYALNEIGESRGTIESFTITVGAPDAPTVEADIQGTFADLNWTEPDDNGAAIQDYVVEYSTDGVNYTRAEFEVSTDRSLRVTSLPGSSSYFFRVAAENEVGFGSYGLTTYRDALPYTGPIITNVDGDRKTSELEAAESRKAEITGERLGGVTKAFVNGQEVEILEQTDTGFTIVLPEGLEPGTYDLYIMSSIGNLTYKDAITITGLVTGTVCANEAMSWWTKRMGETEVKVYIKCPELNAKIRVLHQTGGSGDYESVYVKTITDENDPVMVINEFGKYIVRTIELEEINRIRIRIDDVELWKVRYNNYPGFVFSETQSALQLFWRRLNTLFS